MPKAKPKIKPIHEVRSEDEEREFWATLLSELKRLAHERDVPSRA
jgi:hypothetical protein